MDESCKTSQAIATRNSHQGKIPRRSGAASCSSDDETREQPVTSGRPWRPGPELCSPQDLPGRKVIQIMLASTRGWPRRLALCTCSLINLSNQVWAESEPQSPAGRLCHFRPRPRTTWVSRQRRGTAFGPRDFVQCPMRGLSSHGMVEKLPASRDGLPKAPNMQNIASALLPWTPPRWRSHSGQVLNVVSRGSRSRGVRRPSTAGADDTDGELIASGPWLPPCFFRPWDGALKSHQMTVQRIPRESPELASGNLSRSTCPPTVRRLRPQHHSRQSPLTTGPSAGTPPSELLGPRALHEVSLLPLRETGEETLLGLVRPGGGWIHRTAETIVEGSCRSHSTARATHVPTQAHAVEQPAPLSKPGSEGPLRQ